MWKQLLRRLMLAVPVLFLVSLMVFSLIHLIPGDPGRTILGPEATPEAVRAFDHRLGLDRPLPEQYLHWLVRVLHGDLGRSLVDGTPVSLLIAQRLPATVELAVGALLLATLVAIPAGIVAATRRGSWSDAAGTFLSLAGLSLPQFWLGLLLILAFAVRLRWLPASGYVPFLQDPGQNLKTMLLPIVVTGLRETAVTMRMMRSSLLDVLGQEYVRTAWAKGLSPAGVILRHATRNALIPVLTTSGLQLAGLLGGLVITETIFVIPGFGRLIVDSILNRDFVTLQGAVLVSALLVIGVNLVVDLLYTVLDPRIQPGGKGARA
ncbi:MAG: ABC transporter permease [Bacillota bacterium]|nr:ABC transporter permease [Bacillota bacterium]